VLACSDASSSEPAKGTIGITLSVSADGVLVPSVREVSVLKVTPEGPAAKAGIAAGDKVVEVDGKRVAGASALQLAPLAKGKRPGESVSVVLQRPDGTVYRTVVVTGPPAK
jgi:putative serine protease PepD